MTTKNDLYVYRVNHGCKRVKKYKLSTFINNVNKELFTKKFFINEKDAIKHIKKNDWSHYYYRVGST